MNQGPRPGTFQGSPDPKSGTRVLSMQEIMKLLENPKFREAVDRVERHDFDGKPSKIKYMVRMQLMGDHVQRMREKENKFVIDQQIKKQKGLL